MIFQFSKKRSDDIFLVWNTMFTGYLKFCFESSVFKFSEMENTVLCRAKKLMEVWYLLITEKLLLWTFQRWEIRSFLSQKVDGKIIFTDYWKVLILNLTEMGNTVFFEPKSWWKDDIYWLLKSSCFELFDDEKYGLFFSQKVDGKMIFTWSFWAFHWNSRTWEIWFFVQCTSFAIKRVNKLGRLSMQQWNCCQNKSVLTHLG